MKGLLMALLIALADTIRSRAKPGECFWRAGWVQVCQAFERAWHIVFLL
jgi:hypothetical protein